ncbi:MULTISPECIES: cation-translocating P-type ATPase [unclassified Bifidobacterium]|uniref:cation-translocating P-type ATPase n=1 Tax=unclassified Bifidobacterium TaxID=2608897 RepID=UPI001125B7D9|nr:MULTISPECIES: cation-translocating P-type ATPase [unclassified Bifidobacterium]TPF78162.1 haloacid dehalogenase [Bifidobacterium sp. UTCIF-1]TPF81121.1 haloacid dehalogenase [Bifidobacterium sp. UTCIF-24]TPF82126.1 haloacid dehalogenase [Bifidobacterium sp. UTCIF-3]TPF85251.1 haloacid dehalogenase [Bifidobacterium sp. UTCIF-36]TPF91087.1 haloacid dehalogenase [Bifidobacterium sp. UTBIF-56]
MNATAAVAMPEIDETGLNAEEVAKRIEAGQTNAMKDSTSRSVKDIVRANVFTLFNGIIFAAMVLVLITGSWKDAVFGFVIIINTGIGIVTELKAKRTLDRLSILVASDVLVRRGGNDVAVSHSDIVMDDLLWIRSGEQVPADGRIIHTWGLELDESMLTGESRTVRHKVGEQICSGATAVSGMALVRVSAVGAHSYAATLTAQAKVYKKTVSDLNKGINTILKFMTFLVVPLCVLLIWSQIRTVGGWNHAFTTGEWRGAVVSAVAGVVGMIPEGLVLLTSLNFAVAAMRLARHNTLVQELESVETLARVDALNLDKTGTITDGGIAFDRLIMLEDAADVGGHGVAAERTVAQALYDCCNEEQPNGTGQAVLAGLTAQGFVAGTVRARIPFSSARKWSSVVDERGERWFMGAPEVILAALQGDNADILRQVNEYADDGDRVLLLARSADCNSEGSLRHGSAGHDAMGDNPMGETAGAVSADTPRLDPQAQPVALVLCSERIRDDAERTLAWFREQGVRCRVISGDNPVTVGAIARRVGLTGDREPVALDARELPDDIHELARVLEHVDVLGRVLPDQKKAIVQALHTQHHVVAMTGDGVNDALALKEADLGIAMGNAAPATKAVAQVVLVDSRFSHLPDVVARGRQVMANMERVASLFLVKTVYSALISLGVVLTQIPYPYLPRHITYIGALTIGIPAFILALAPNTRRYVPGFLKRVIKFALPGGVATALSVLLAAWFLPGVMGWNITGNDDDLSALRATSAIILFLMGVFVLARVASPLNSWRGGLVAFFATAGVIGTFIPFVARFFALILPTGTTLTATLIALAGAAVIFVLCLWLVPKAGSILARFLRRSGINI